jgi:hypothetical protein
MRTNEVCKKLGLKASTLGQWIYIGVVPAPKLRTSEGKVGRPGYEWTQKEFDHLKKIVTERRARSGGLKVNAPKAKPEAKPKAKSKVKPKGKLKPGKPAAPAKNKRGAINSTARGNRPLKEVLADEPNDTAAPASIPVP